jgi:glycine/D-amino acid oxidase-like deaminating enzyme
MPLARHDAPISLWDVSAIEQDCSVVMDGAQSAEVVVIGGGFTGLSTALHAAQKGLDCLVLEANHIGYGGSGRNVGLVNAGLWLPPQDVRAKLGEAGGAALVDLLGRAPDYVFSLIEKHQIQCEPTRAGTIHAAHSPAGYEDLARRAEEWRRLGAPVDLLSREDAARKIGTSVFHGGLLDRRAGTINPMAYARGLARAASAAGARIFTGVRVKSLRPNGDGWRVETTSGPVDAKKVVLGTEAYSDALWPGVNTALTIIHYFQFATEPLGPKADYILKERQGLWDTGAIMFSLRRDAYNRLIIGSMGSVIGGLTGLSKRWATKKIQRLFPDLGPVKFETAWHGRIGMTPDHLPRIHRLADGVYAPIGYNGRGITPGTMFGRAMADLLSGGSEEDLPLPVSPLEKAPNRAVMSRLYELAFTANQLIKSV